MIKAVFSASLLQSSVSCDPSEIILICWFAAQETFLIIIDHNCSRLLIGIVYCLTIFGCHYYIITIMNVNWMIHSRDVNLLHPARSEHNSIIKRRFVQNITSFDMKHLMIMTKSAFGLNLKTSGKSLDLIPHGENNTLFFFLKEGCC